MYYIYIILIYRLYICSLCRNSSKVIAFRHLLLLNTHVCGSCFQLGGDTCARGPRCNAEVVRGFLTQLWSYEQVLDAHCDVPGAFHSSTEGAPPMSCGF